MKKYYVSFIIVTIFTIIFISCTKNEDEQYVQVSPVNINYAQVPLPKLSDYNFFQGDIKLQNPVFGVIPYEPASSLFADYAHKKRFVWMPSGKSATYDGDDNVLDFPVGSVLIKTFYYENVQPNNTTKIIETRLLIKVEDDKITPTTINGSVVNVKSSGWKLYDYVWNESQTDAILDVEGFGNFVPVTFKENGVTKSVEYKIPSQSECTTCHKLNKNQENGGEISIPIGPKPQNLNTNYNYGTSTRNQLQMWMSNGYIDNSMPNLNTIRSAVNYKDTSKSLESRARSYMDINCAHCHRVGGHCDYVPQRFNLSNTDMYTFGVCLPPIFNIPDNPFVIKSGDADHSELIYRLSSDQGSEMMPIIGRTLIHDEGVQLMKDWINSLPNACP